MNRVPDRSDQFFASKHPQSGMTLLEVLVVLVIIGLVVATASPPMVRVVESVRFKTQTDEIARQIRDLRIAALLERRTLTLNSSTRSALPSAIADAVRSPEDPSQKQVEDYRTVTLEDGWVLDGDDIVFLKTGVCLGGKVLLQSPTGRAKTMQFKAPDCSLVDSDVR